MLVLTNIEFWKNNNFVLSRKIEEKQCFCKIGANKWFIASKAQYYFLQYFKSVEYCCSFSVYTYGLDLGSSKSEISKYDAANLRLVCEWRIWCIAFIIHFFPNTIFHSSAPISNKKHLFFKKFIKESICFIYACIDICTTSCAA